MKRYKDLTGQRFGLLLVIKYNGNDKSKKALWLCQCDCGEIKTFIGSHLVSGHTKSCGCLQKELTVQKSTTHGKRHTKIYSVWVAMKKRCLNQNDNRYQYYGARGISVCEEWFDFQNFYDWAMANGYQKGLSIERKDNDGDYCPENCTWANRTTQMNNTRSNHFLEYNGKRKTISQWARIIGIGPSTLRQRIVKYKWPIDKALTVPPRYGNDRANF